MPQTQVYTGPAGSAGGIPHPFDERYRIEPADASEGVFRGTGWTHETPAPPFARPAGDLLTELPDVEFPSLAELERANHAVLAALAEAHCDNAALRRTLDAETVARESAERHAADLRDQLARARVDLQTLRGRLESAERWAGDGAGESQHARTGETAGVA